MLEKIKTLIPQREPFLFIQEILEESPQTVTAGLKLTGQEDFFRGHFPGNPVLPGVIMCEACFQTGAYLMALRGQNANAKNQTALVTRIQSAKFKSMAKPGDHLKIEVQLSEELANAAYMKGKILCEGRTIMMIDFAAALV
jgi:3-hydroxyacyl-[acyl-carrier-protein] dehydratase